MPQIKDVAYKILKRAGKPLHISTITDLVMNEIDIKSETPKKSVNSVLQRDPRFKRVDRGTFTINEKK